MKEHRRNALFDALIGVSVLWAGTRIYSHFKQTEYLRAAFEKADTNRDGQLDVSEVVTVYHQIGLGTGEIIGRLDEEVKRKALEQREPEFPKIIDNSLWFPYDRSRAYTSFLLHYADTDRDRVLGRKELDIMNPVLEEKATLRLNPARDENGLVDMTGFFFFPLSTHKNSELAQYLEK